MGECTPGAAWARARHASFITLRSSRFVFGRVFAHHALVALQLPLMIWAPGEPVGNADLRVDGARAHGDARLLTGGHDFLKAELAVAEKSDKSNKHGNL